MTRSLKSMLAYEANRKPAIADLVARVYDMTDAEIAAAAVPLPWYRKALLELRAERRGLDLANLVDFGFTPDMAGHMRRWDGPTMFIGLDKGEIEMRPGDLVLICADGVWIDTLFSRKIDARLANLSTAMGATTRSGYMQACSERRSRLAPQSAPDEPQRLGVRFTKLL